MPIPVDQRHQLWGVVGEDDRRLPGVLLTHGGGQVMAGGRSREAEQSQAGVQVPPGPGTTDRELGCPVVLEDVGAVVPVRVGVATYHDRRAGLPRRSAAAQPVHHCRDGTAGAR
ncbi:hypothetical protein SDC9_133801 [bioreactor metagenome]|uniref:Uncharacterized protein n=1 Tax=bioreactor metagenome TaxID=1076179 RepID=A0A645DB82_9ZZZZ